MRIPDQHSSDDEIYSWLVDYLDGEGRAAREVRDGVIEIVLEHDDVEGEGVQGQRVELLLTRQQLRAAAWSEWDIFDDREPDVLQRATDPVRAGLGALTMYLDEALETVRPDESYVVIHRGSFYGSVVPEAPPVRGSEEEFEIARGSGYWSAYSPDDPRFGEPGSIFGDGDGPGGDRGDTK